MEKAFLMDYLQNCSRIRLVLGVDSLLFRELLRDTIADELDIEVVGCSSDDLGLLAMVGETAADAVLLSWPESREMPAICTHLFAEYPHLTVLGITPDGGEVICCRQTIAISQHPASTPNELLQVVRNSRVEEQPPNSQTSSFSSSTSNNSSTPIRQQSQT